MCLRGCEVGRSWLGSHWFAALGDGGSAPGPPAGGRCTSPCNPQAKTALWWSAGASGLVVVGRGRSEGEWEWEGEGRWLARCESARLG